MLTRPTELNNEVKNIKKHKKNTKMKNTIIKM